MRNTLASCHWGLPADGPMRGICMAAELGLDGIELDIGSYEAGLPLSRPEVRASFSEWRESYQVAYPSLAVNALCQHGMSEPGAGQVAQACIARAVETAAALGIPLVQLPSFVAGDITTDEGFASTVECLRYACQLAEPAGIFIGSENPLPAEDQLRLVSAVAHPSLRLYFDTRNHYSMRGLDTPSILEAVYPHVIEVHLKDGTRDGRQTLLGEGDASLFASMHILAQRG